VGVFLLWWSIDSCITILKAQGPSRAESKEKEEKVERKGALRVQLIAVSGVRDMFRIPGFGFRIPDCGFRVSGFGRSWKEDTAADIALRRILQVRERFRVSGFGTKKKPLSSKKTVKTRS